MNRKFTLTALAVAAFLTLGAVIQSVKYAGGASGLATDTLSPGACLRTTFTNTADEVYIWVGGMEVSILFEIDPDGSTAGGAVTVMGCTQADDDANGTKDPSACQALELFDSDANNILDTGSIDGTAGQRFASGLQLAGWLHYDATDVTNSPQIVTCAQR